MTLPTSVATPEGEAGWIRPRSTPETETLLPLALADVDGALGSGTSTFGRRLALSISRASFLSLLWFLLTHEQQPAGRSASCFLYSALCSAEMYMKTRDLSVE
eukprot:scaffold13069_cov50-Phaeocystis_antarctica.AAC.2